MVTKPSTTTQETRELWRKEFPREDGIYWLRFADLFAEPLIVEVSPR